MALRKKGIFFTLISLFIVAILVLVASSQSTVTLKDEVPITQTAVSIGNNYIKNLDEVYLSRTLKVVSYRALRTLIWYMNSTPPQGFLKDKGDFDKKFAELVVNGTIDGAPVVVNGQNFMLNYNLTKRLADIENISMRVYNLNTTFNKDYSSINYSVIAFQSADTRSLQVAVNVTLNYTVNATLAYWQRVVVIQAQTPIYQLDDPLYALNWTTKLPLPASPMAFTNKILMTSTSIFNVTTLWQFINSSQYRYSARAPSFLSRFYNDYTASQCCGMESAVNPALINNNLYDEGRPWPEKKSYIDWCYFGPQPRCKLGSRLWNITGVSNYTPGGYNNAFILDTDSAILYNVSDWINTTYCEPDKTCYP
ncbi:MAG: hypothetical protein V1702_05635 [Candidatus Woesearchaeota archaeon]